MWLPISQDSVVTPAPLASARGEVSAPAAPASLPAFSKFRVRQDFLSGRVAAKVGVGSWGGGEATAKNMVLVYEAMLATDREDDVEIDGALWRARYGAGVRVEVTVTEVSAEAHADIYSVALQATLKSVSAGFEIKLLGITDPEVIKLVPGPAPFDITSYEKVLEAVNMVREKMTTGAIALSPVLTHVYMGPAPRSADLVRSQALVFGVRKVADGETPEKARAAAIERRISSIAVDAVYQQFAPRIQDGERPSKETRRAAERWLDTDELIQR